MAKVKDHPNLDKSNGSVVSTDREAYKKRKQVIKNQQRLVELENNQTELRNELNDMSTKMDLIISLLGKIGVK